MELLLLLLFTAATLGTLLLPRARQLWRACFKKPSQSTLVVQRGGEVVTLNYRAAEDLTEADRERLVYEALAKLTKRRGGAADAR